MNQMFCVPLTSIKPNPQQPRRLFDEDELWNLANSIKAVGVIQAITIKSDGNGGYLIVDGERRWRAAKLAGLADIPATLSNTQHDIGLLALIANMQRSDLNPIEEAYGYAELIENGFSKAKIAQKCGISLPTINNRLSLLAFDKGIQDLFARGLLPIHKRAVDALLTVEDPEIRGKLAKKLARPGLTVKSIEMACMKLNAATNAVPAGKHNPALEYSARKAGDINLPEWDILYQLNKVPKWPVITDAALEICDRCALRMQASSVTCSDCPAVMFLSALIQRSHDGHV